VTNSTTDEHGVVEFIGLPGSRYSVQVIVHECPSAEPSLAPSSTSLPSSIPTSTNFPSTPPTRKGGALIGQETDPCVGGDAPLVGAIVKLIGVRNVVIDQTVTDDEGYYVFEVPPPGMRYTLEVDYPDCDRRELINMDHTSPVTIPSDRGIKFYRNGNFCGIKFSPGESDYEVSTADVADFDTIDECCANIFWYDIDGCFSRSHDVIQFEFCLDVSMFGEHSNCPMNEIQAIEFALQRGLGSNSKLSLLEFGDTMLAEVKGVTTCIEPTSAEDHKTNQMRGVAAPREINICGVVTTKESECRDEICLRNSYRAILGLFKHYFDSKEFTLELQHFRTEDGSQPLLAFRSAKAVASSFMVRKLSIPPAITMAEPTNGKAAEFEDSSITSDYPRFYPTYISGELCRSKTSFSSWEEPYETLKECCKAHFSWDYDVCCSSLKFGGFL